MTTQSPICGLDKPSRPPDELPDNDHAVRCTGPDVHVRSLSVNAGHQPGRTGFTPKRSLVRTQYRPP
jgi:hypothetical protein